MPGRFFLESPISEVGATLDAPLGSLSDEPARRNIAPGQNVVVYDGSLRHMR